LKQDGVNLSRVLKRQAADLLRKSEHDVEIRNGQKLCLPFGEPLGAGRGLALGAVAIAAGNGELPITCLMGSNSLWRV
jgi:hypothetical protein